MRVGGCFDVLNLTEHEFLAACSTGTVREILQTGMNHRFFTEPAYFTLVK